MGVWLPIMRNYGILWPSIKEEGTMIGRKEELKLLKAAYNSPESEFVSVYGRRRIGKTYLVNEAFNYGFSFHAVGLRREGLRR